MKISREVHSLHDIHTFARYKEIGDKESCYSGIISPLNFIFIFFINRPILCFVSVLKAPDFLFFFKLSYMFLYCMPTAQIVINIGIGLLYRHFSWTYLSPRPARFLGCSWNASVSLYYSHCEVLKSAPKEDVRKRERSK